MSHLYEQARPLFGAGGGSTGPAIPDPPLIQGWHGELVVYPYSFFGQPPPNWDDMTQLNAAIQQAQYGRTVRLISGLVYTARSPFLGAGGVTIKSDGLPGVSSKGSTSDIGSAVIQVASNWANVSPLTGAPLAVAGLANWLGSGDGGQPNSNQGGMQNVWLDLSLAPAALAWGIVLYGQYGAGVLDRVLVAGLDVGGAPVAGGPGGLVLMKGAGSGKSPDGWQAHNCLFQFIGGVGVWEQACSDFYATGCHAQNCQLDCWRIGGGQLVPPTGSFHPRHIACRGDVSVTGSGIFWDQPIGSAPLDAAGWALGGTQLNARYGHEIANGRGAGKSDPITIIGDVLDGDTLGGVSISGPNDVKLIGISVDITSGNPLYGLVTASNGTAVPDRVRALGCELSGATAPLNDTAGIDGGNMMIDTATYAATGSGLTTYNDRRGTATLAGGTATVNTPWVTANSLIQLTRLSQGAGPGELSPGVITPGVSFTVVSSSGTDTGKVLWALT